MEITINNQLKKIAESSITVQQLLHQEIPGKQQGIAIAINNQVIPRNRWEHSTIYNEDRIIIIRATQGG